MLAITQFTVILDFMIMAPMGDLLMKSIHLTPAQFGLAVSAYAFSAGLSGLLTAGFADRFDRKKLLVFFYIGFIIGTFLCSLATDYTLLVAARIFTGLFGGVIGSISMAIITDIFKAQQRGRVMGYVQLGLGASQVMGIPLGLYIGNAWGWQSAFLWIVGLAILTLILIVLKLSPVTAHLGIKREHTVLRHLWNTFAKKEHRIGFLATALLSVGGFMMPFSSVFAINNLGVSHENLPLLFMMSGISSLVVMPLIGRLSDQFDKFKIYTIGSVWMMIMVLVYTSLGPTDFALVVFLNILMMIGILSRMTPSSALVSFVPEVQDRGAFMSINSSLQQLAGGTATYIAGLVVYQKTVSSPLEHYDQLGYIVVILSLISIWITYRVSVIAKRKQMQ